MKKFLFVLFLLVVPFRSFAVMSNIYPSDKYGFLINSTSTLPYLVNPLYFSNNISNVSDGTAPVSFQYVVFSGPPSYLSSSTVCSQLKQNGGADYQGHNFYNAYGFFDLSQDFQDLGLMEVDLKVFSSSDCSGGSLLLKTFKADFTSAWSFTPPEGGTEFATVTATTTVFATSTVFSVDIDYLVVLGMVIVMFVLLICVKIYIYPKFIK